MKKLNKILFFLFLSMLFIILCGYVNAQPSEVQLKALRSAMTVQIVVEQSYGNAKDVNLPFKNYAQRLCENAGIKVVTSDVNNYDLRLMIKANGKASGELYKGNKNIESVYLYTGASLSGSISFEMEGIPAYKQDFMGYKKPDESTFPSDNLKTPSAVPFRVVFRQPGSFSSKIMEMMAEIYGTDCIVKALKGEDVNISEMAGYVLGKVKDPHAVESLISLIKDEHFSIRRNAIRALGKIGDPRAIEPLSDALINEDDVIVRCDVAQALGNIGDPRAIEPLIAALKDGVVEYAAMESLKRLTGKNFLYDKEKWYKWWVENKETFLIDR
jgi:hypothetical protein